MLKMTSINDCFTNFVSIFKLISQFEFQVQHSPITSRSADKTKNALPNYFRADVCRVFMFLCDFKTNFFTYL